MTRGDEIQLETRCNTKKLPVVLNGVAIFGRTSWNK